MHNCKSIVEDLQDAVEDLQEIQILVFLGGGAVQCHCKVDSSELLYWRWQLTVGIGYLNINPTWEVDKLVGNW